MCNFIEDYLQNPTLAVANAKADADKRFCSMLIDDAVIYDQIATSEYHLYEAIALFDKAIATEHMYVSSSV